MSNAPLAGRAALCHEWFTTMGGSDICAARIASILGIEQIFTFTYQEALVRELFDDGVRVKLAHRMGNSLAARQHWQRFLPLMPHAWRSLDLSGFDLVVTSSHACSNAIRVPDGMHVSYCYTPMRYAWDPRREMSRFPPLLRTAWPAAAALLRRMDRGWAQRVDAYIAISRTVAERIERFYGRDSSVVYPPVDTDFFTPGEGARDYYLAAGRLVAYKRFDLAVDAFSHLGYPLVVAGSGPDLDRLRARAGPNVTFETQPSKERLRDLYRGAVALVFPGVEDFGIVPVEAQACGTPVIAQDRGGATETVVHGTSGALYPGEDVGSVIEGVRALERMSIDAGAVRRNTERFAAGMFDTAFLAAVRSAVER